MAIICHTNKKRLLWSIKVDNRWFKQEADVTNFTSCSLYSLFLLYLFEPLPPTPVIPAKVSSSVAQREFKCFEEECVRDPTGNLQNQLFYSTLWGELLCNSISTVEKSILAVTCHGQVDKIDSE